MKFDSIRFLHGAIFSVLTLPALSYGGGDAVYERQLCNVNEVTVFNCTLRGRVASLCASKGDDHKSGYAQYRFSKDGRVEMTYPATLEDGKRYFKLSSKSYGGGGETHLRFTSEGYDYILFESTKKGDYVPGGVRQTLFDSGISVVKKGRLVSSFSCKGTSGGIDSIAYEIFDNEPFKPLILKNSSGR